MSRLTLQTLLIASVGVVAVACKSDKGGDTGPTVTPDGGTDGGIDADGDGYFDTEDCNDNDASVNPGAAEACDGIDNDCDDEIDEGMTSAFYADSDGDGFGDATVSDELCEALEGWVPNSSDCDDTDASVHPGAVELCDGMDNDCDSDIDEELDSAVWYADNDLDGLGDPADTTVACDRPDGYVNNDWDCDDGDDSEPVFVSGSGTVSVPGSGGGDSGDTWGAPGSGAAGSVTNPFESIQDGIDASDVCVYVTGDRYGEDIDFGGKNILVWGIDGAAGTIIEGSGRGPVVTFDDGETAGATLSGFTVTGGAGNRTTATSTSDCGCATTCTTTTYTYAGGGIYIEGASPTLEDLIVEDNQLAPYSYTRVSDYEDNYVYSYGGGIYVENGRPTISSSIIRNNFADGGGGLYADSASNVKSSQSVFDENSASSGGGIGSEGTISSTNVVFVNNAASGSGSSIGGAGIDVSSGVTTLTNVTGAGNDGQGSVYIAASGSATILNSIIAENAGYDILDGESGATLSITYSTVYNSVGGGYSSVFTDMTGTSGNLDSDPLFVSWSDDGDYSNDDLSLRATSPAVDAGNPNPTYYDADGSTNDQGAWGGPNGSW
jgi:hypothetical protein